MGERGVSMVLSIENFQPEVLRIGRVSMVLKIKIPDLLKKDNICVVKQQFSI